MECERCGECCRIMYFPLGEDTQDCYEWIRLHGLRVVDIEGQAHVEVEVPCEALVGDECSIYARRPQMCREAGCLKKEEWWPDTR